MESAMSVQGIPSSRHSQVVSRAPFTQCTSLHSILTLYTVKSINRNPTHGPRVGIYSSPPPLYLHAERRKTFFKDDFFDIFQHFFICRPSYSTVSKNTLPPPSTCTKREERLYLKRIFSIFFNTSSSAAPHIPQCRRILAPPPLPALREKKDFI
jgi:hypothetical protein